MSSNIVLAFDAYGTLLSTESIAKQLETHFGQEKAKSIAAKWRLYQLEYTWRLNSMRNFIHTEQYLPFSTVTARALKHALSEAGVSLSDSQMESLMQSYDSLSTFPDVAGCLRAVSSDANIKAVVFSNGTLSMVSSSVKNSPDLAPQAAVFKDIVVVEDVQRFKPDTAVYRYLCKKVGKEGKENEVWLVSGNPFDVVGARAVGLNVAWVDRTGAGWVDECISGDKGKPSVIVRSLEDVVSAVRGYMK